MKVVVYFEDGKHSEVVAQFASEKLYMACLPVLGDIAYANGQIVTESVREDEILSDSI